MDFLSQKKNNGFSRNRIKRATELFDFLCLETALPRNDFCPLQTFLQFLNSVGKALQINDFAKRNCTLIVTHIVSKLACNYG